MIDCSLTSSEIQGSFDYLIVDLDLFPQMSLEEFLSQDLLFYQPWSPFYWDELDEFYEEADALW